MIFKRILLIMSVSVLPACTSLQQIFEASSFKPDERSGFSAQPRLSIYRVLSGHAANSGLPADVPPSIAADAAAACRGAAPPAGPAPMVVGPIAATVLVALGTIAFNEVSHEIQGRLSRYAEGFTKGATGSLNLTSSQGTIDGSCLLLVRSGKHPSAPRESEPVPLWYAAFAMPAITPPNARARGLAITPVYAHLLRSAARTRQGSQINLAITVRLRAAARDVVPDQFVMRRLVSSKFIFSDAPFDGAFRSGGVSTFNPVPGQGEVFPAPMPEAFGSISFAVTEEGYGGEAFSKTAEFLARHDETVRSLLVDLGEDSFLLDRLTLDRSGDR